MGSRRIRTAEVEKNVRLPRCDLRNLMVAIHEISGNQLLFADLSAANADYYVAVRSLKERFVRPITVIRRLTLWRPSVITNTEVSKL
ncbi:hypothetical protein T01_10261 [Trichinella spiralis]|uniref:Uncharacterized protein n=1 Tax=Trichinella spiralis TaxID=6334 RepID=A0A0V1B784_TRISP|nr:hypothetical protein T01_10261 [Trichinella spiralis]